MPLDHVSHALDTAPSWLRQQRGEDWLTVVNAARDALVVRLKESVKARFLLIAPSDALPRIGADSLLERFPNQTDEQYRAWLRDRWMLWTFAGTPAQLLVVFAEAGFVGTTIETARDVDPFGADWSRFWVDLYPPFPAWTGFPGHLGAPTQWTVRLYAQVSPMSGDPWKFGELAPDGTPYTWGSTASTRQVAYVQRITAQWRPAHVRLAAIRVHLVSGDVLSWVEP